MYSRLVVLIMPQCVYMYVCMYVHFYTSLSNVTELYVINDCVINADCTRDCVINADCTRDCVINADCTRDCIINADCCRDCIINATVRPAPSPAIFLPPFLLLMK